MSVLNGHTEVGAAAESYEHESLGAPGDFGPLTLEFGTVGWTGDDDVFDLGTDANDGSTLVKVTLLRGHPAGEPMSADETPGANGYRVLAQLSWPLWVIPTKGSRCVVAFPGGGQRAPGAGIIIAVPMKSPLKNFSATTAKLDLTGYDLVIKAKSISLRDDDNNLLSVSPDGGVRACDKTGSGFFVSGGVALMQCIANGKTASAMMCSSDTAGLTAGGGTALKLKGTDCTVTCVNANIGAFGAVCLGAKASPTTAIAVGPLGSPGMAAVCSMSLFGQP